MTTTSDYKNELDRILERFGANVRQHRTDHEGLSQEGLAELSGLHRTEIGRIELGTVEPRLATILIIAHYLHTTPNDLVEGLWIPVHRKPRPEAVR